MSTKPSFENHIRHMFRDIDVENMSFMFDFTSYEDVKTNSKDILMCLKGEGGRSQMPPVWMGGPWPEEWISLFERWINEEYPR